MPLQSVSAVPAAVDDEMGGIGVFVDLMLREDAACHVQVQILPDDFIADFSRAGRIGIDAPGFLLDPADRFGAGLDPASVTFREIRIEAPVVIGHVELVVIHAVSTPLQIARRPFPQPFAPFRGADRHGILFEMLCFHPCVRAVVSPGRHFRIPVVVGKRGV